MNKLMAAFLKFDTVEKYRENASPRRKRAKELQHAESKKEEETKNVEAETHV
jgi:hypothetical protein